MRKEKQLRAPSRGQKETMGTRQQGSQRIKFNLSFDNLRPFMQTARTPPKHTSYPPPRSERVRPASKTEESVEMEERLRMRSPDVAREASNLILRAIELKGIGCMWD